MAALAPQPLLLGDGGRRADAAKLLCEIRDVTTRCPAGAEDYQTALRGPAEVLERSRSARPRATPHANQRAMLSLSL
jgi:hypothetical protein